jgi:branched-chain amino acid transport system permease protein
VNVVHGELLLLGAYLGFVLFQSFGMDPFVSMLIVVPLLFLVGYPVQRWLLSPLMWQGLEAPMLTTFGLSIIAQNLYLFVWKSNTRGIKTSYSDTSLSIGSVQTPMMLVIAFALALVLALGLHLFLSRTMVGKAIRATAQSESTAAVMGINVRHIHAITYGIGAAITAVGGILVASTFTFVPSSGLVYLLKGFVVVVLGGMGSIAGTLLGGIILGVTESWGAAAFSAAYQNMVGLVIFLIVLAVRPRGLFGRS